MRVDGPNSIAPAATQHGAPNAAQPAPAVLAGRREMKPAAPSSADLSVVVEIQKDNRLVFRFVDQAGQVVQQIPSEQLLHLSEAIARFLQRASK